MRQDNQVCAGIYTVVDVIEVIDYTILSDHFTTILSPSYKTLEIPLLEHNAFFFMRTIAIFIVVLCIFINFHIIYQSTIVLINEQSDCFCWYSLCDYNYEDK